MKVKYDIFRMGYVRVTKEAEPYHYVVSDGYVEYSSVRSIEVCVSGALIVTVNTYDVFIHAPGTWVHFNTTPMETDF